MLRIHEDVQLVKHKKSVVSVKKCIISNSLDGNEYSVLSEGSRSSDNDILIITVTLVIRALDGFYDQ